MPGNALAQGEGLAYAGACREQADAPGVLQVIQPGQSAASQWAAPTVDSPGCPCWWVIRGRQQKVLPPFPTIGRHIQLALKRLKEEMEVLSHY